MKNREYQYFVLNTAEKWRKGSAESIRIHDHGMISLSALQQISSTEAIHYATGFAVDENKNIYIIDAEQCLIFKYTIHDKTFAPIHCIGGYGIEAGQFNFMSNDPLDYAGNLAVNRKVFYVSDTYNHRIQSFYISNFRLRQLIGKTDANGVPVPGEEPGEFNIPKDIVLDSKGNLYVLDSGNKRIQKFNRFGNFITIIGVNSDEAPEQPESMTIDRNDFIYVIDAGRSHISKFDENGKWCANIGNFDSSFKPSAIAVDKQGFIYIGEKGPANSLKIYKMDQQGTVIGQFGNYSHRCYQLFSDDNNNLYASWGEPGEIAGLFGDDKFAADGTYYSTAFDSCIRECHWHRLAVEADIPDKTRMDICFHASDQPIDANRISDWKSVISSPVNSFTSKDGLFIEAKGRYLRLKIELSGDRLHSPTLSQIKIYFQRLSYLRYLPATFQEDEKSRVFLEHFLSMFESVSYDMEQLIAHLAKYFDPQAVDREFLSWFSSWLAISPDENWSEQFLRDFIEQAFDLYVMRGTIPGLCKMVELFTGKIPRIIEHHLLYDPIVIRENSVIGLSTVVGKAFTKRLVLEETSTIGDFLLEEDEDPPETPFQANAYDFSIFINTFDLKDQAQIEALKRLIHSEKPAHTRCHIYISEGSMQIGKHSFLEIDTIIGKGYAPMKLGEKAAAGVNTFLGAAHPQKGAVGTRSLIGIDAILH